MDNPEEFRCISLCTGYAGIELGLKRVIPALRTVCYVEVEAFACANLVAKIEKGLLDAAPIWTDIKTFNGKPFRKRVHIITAGYPCQGESVAGKRQGKSDPRWLWPHIERIIKTVEPLWFFGENVSGHLTLGFPTVYRSLRNLGYKVEARLFTAAECGAPHKRERLFILAKSNRGGIGQGYELCNTDISARPSELADTALTNTTRQQQLGNNISLPQSKKMANTSPTELQKRQGQQENNGEKCTAVTGSCDKWPSRPGQPQYEWEEPRVVGDTRGKKRTGLSGNERETISEVGKASPSILDDSKLGNKRAIKLDIGQGEGEIDKHRRANTPRSKTKGQAQSSVGRAANGTQIRVDRLRLLGNGVVPQQAEKAFRELIKRFSDARE